MERKKGCQAEQFESRDSKRRKFAENDRKYRKGKSLPKDLVIRIKDDREALSQDLWLHRRLSWPKVKVKTWSLSSSCCLIKASSFLPGRKPSWNFQEQS